MIYMHSHAGEFYGVHLNEEYAKNTRFEKRIAQGTLSVAFSPP